MPLTELDQQLLERCLERKPRAWEDFVDRYLGVVAHVVNHSAQICGIRLTREDHADLCAEILRQLIKDDFAILRRFRRQSSLPTYLTVVARRIVVGQLLKRRRMAALRRLLGGQVETKRRWPQEPWVSPKTASARCAASPATKCAAPRSSDTWGERRSV